MMSATFIYFSLPRPIQQHQTVLGSDQQVDAPQCRTQDLRVEALLVFTNLRRVARGIMLRCRRNINIYMTFTSRCAARTAGAEAEREEASLFLLEGKRMWMH